MRIAEARKECNKLKLEESSKCMNFVNNQQSSYKKQIFEKHKKIEMQVNSLEQVKEQMQQFYKLGNEIRVQRLMDKNGSPLRSLLMTPNMRQAFTT